ncbi:MAG: adenosylmethionine--8-amino-7-oxononanoate transaminase [Thermodesulfobacteria bacterium]|nr:adenosylmethionine--8-amino-7-oxononanoate transaminase [Thermodesulfobacteriota bacterium]
MDIETLLKLDKELIWHPYTQMKDFEERDLLYVDRAENVFLFDHRGKAYFDTISSWWCITHGHNHPVIMERIREQLQRLDQVQFAGTTHQGPIELASRLRGYLPDALEKFFFSDNGSTAVEVAIKMSFQYWKHVGQPKRELFVSLEHGYHGDTLGTMGLGGVPAFEGPFDALTFDSLRVPAPYCYRCPAGKELYEPGRGRRCSLECFGIMEEEVERRADEICAVVVEPLLMGAGGMLVYPTEYLSRLSRLCQKHGIHLILDEVATGFGRTGKMFAMDHAGICPDFVCLSKGITGGTLPLAVTVTTKGVFDAFYADYSLGKTFFHGHTFTANPICSAAALGSLDVFESEGVLEKLPERISFLQGEKERFLDIDIVGDVRGIGMVAAFELVKDKASRASFDSKVRAGWQVYLRGLEKGLVLRPLADVIYLFLPLCTTREQMATILDKTEETLKEVSGTLTP